MYIVSTKPSISSAGFSPFLTMRMVLSSFESFEREVFALYGNQHRVCGRKDIHRRIAQRGGAVDQDIVVTVAHALHDAADHVVSVLHLR